MTKPLLAILLLLRLSVSAGELDGKFLVCDRMGKKDLFKAQAVGWKFKDGIANVDMVDASDSGVVSVNGNSCYGFRVINVKSKFYTDGTVSGFPYKAFPASVWWWHGSDASRFEGIRSTWERDRQTLRLQEVQAVGEKEFPNGTYQCESVETQAAYEQALERRRTGLQLKVKQFLDSRKI